MVVPDIFLHLSSDEMTAYIDVPANSGGALSLNILHTLLRRHHVVQGVDNDLLLEIVKGTVTGKDIVIALGVAAQPAVDGHLEWLIEYRESVRIAVSHYASGVPFSLPDLLSVVKKGDKIVRIHPPAAGAPGITVTGSHVATDEAAEIEIIAGTGTVRENDHIVAAIDGTVWFDGTKVEIRKYSVLKGNVCAGNIDFDGTIAVEGDILPGVNMYISGDLIVAGNVDDAKITGGGTMVINGNINGAGQGTITSHCSVAARSMTRFSLVSGGDVSFSEGVQHSQIISDGSVRARTVVGGSITAHSIIVEAAGSSAGEYTILDSTRNRQLAQERYDLLKRFGTITTDRAEMVEKMYTLVSEGMDDEGILAATGIAELDEMKTRMESLHHSSVSVRQRLSSIEESERRHAGNSCIAVGRVFPGTMLKSDKRERLIDCEERDVKLV